MSNYLNLVSYFGGKFPHLKWVIDQFPKGNYHFIDIMCGSANVALNVDYPLVTVNDINDDIINLFHVLRDHYDEFLRAIYFTPFARKELESIIDKRISGIEITEIERARQYFTLCQLGYGANGSQNNHYGFGCEWKIQRSNYYRVDNWNLKLDKLSIIVDKLRHFQVQKKPALELFSSVNKRGNIVYFDPPYLLSLRKSKKIYTHEVDVSFHEQLAQTVRNAECFVAISGYDSELYNDLFQGFNKVIDKVKKNNVGKIALRECMWVNYDINVINNKLRLF